MQADMRRVVNGRTFCDADVYLNPKEKCHIGGDAWQLACRPSLFDRRASQGCEEERLLEKIFLVVECQQNTLGTSSQTPDGKGIGAKLHLTFRKHVYQ
jgi:hypothetical protein